MLPLGEELDLFFDKSRKGIVLSGNFTVYWNSNTKYHFYSL